jgi:carbonic anhydrase/SulP family sulfate permease
MTKRTEPLASTLVRDLTAGLVVFLVALPLCLGVALASNAPLFAGVVAGIVGGVLVGMLSGSHSSVSGPAAGLTAVVAVQILTLGSFQAFLLVVVIAGLIQVVLGVARLGLIAEFIPSSVIKGLLAAIGVILILKQAPVVLGYRSGPPAETVSEFLARFHVGSASIGVVSVLLLEIWGHTKFLKKSVIPSALVVVLLGVGVSAAFQQLGGAYSLDALYLVQVPVAKNLGDFIGFLQLPDFTQLGSPLVYTAAITVAAVASLETLLNLEAVDKLDPQKRASPPNRELIAQGVGNVVCGLIGGLPVTSVIVRSSVNLNAGGRTKLSAIVHGVLLLVCVLLLPTWLNQIPLSCLAAILVVTGFKLASPKLIRQKWSKGKYQYVPFFVTVVAIVATDLLVGVLIGLAVGVFFVLLSNLRSPLKRTVEQSASGEVVRIELPNQVSFLNRAALSRALHQVPRGGHVILDARATHYIDPDVIEMIRDFKELTDPPYDVTVSLLGFNGRYGFEDHVQYEAAAAGVRRVTPAAYESGSRTDVNGAG